MPSGKAEKAIGIEHPVDPSHRKGLYSGAGFPAIGNAKPKGLDMSCESLELGWLDRNAETLPERVLKRVEIRRAVEVFAEEDFLFTEIIALAGAKIPDEVTESSAFSVSGNDLQILSEFWMLLSQNRPLLSTALANRTIRQAGFLCRPAKGFAR